MRKYPNGTRVMLAPGATREWHGTVVGQAVRLPIVLVHWDGQRKPVMIAERDVRPEASA